MPSLPLFELGAACMLARQLPRFVGLLSLPDIHVGSFSVVLYRGAWRPPPPPTGPGASRPHRYPSPTPLAYHCPLLLWGHGRGEYAQILSPRWVANSGNQFWLPLRALAKAIGHEWPNRYTNHT